MRIFHSRQSAQVNTLVSSSRAVNPSLQINCCRYNIKVESTEIVVTRGTLFITTRILQYKECQSVLLTLHKIFGRKNIFK